MKIIAVGDEDTVIGLKLAGIDEGYIPLSSDDAVKYITEKVYNDSDVGLIILTERLARKIREKIKEFFERERPIFVEIPDKYGAVEEDVLRDLVRKAIGVEIKL